MDATKTPDPDRTVVALHTAPSAAARLGGIPAPGFGHLELRNPGGGVRPCPHGHHLWHPRGYHNGCAVCLRCGWFGSRVFYTRQVGLPCEVCGTRAWWASVKSAPGAPDVAEVDQARHVCARHAPPDPLAVIDEIHDALREAPGVVLPPTDWFTGFLPDPHQPAAGLPAADLARQLVAVPRPVLTGAIEDGAAHLVDQQIAGHASDEDLATLRTAWRALHPTDEDAQ